MDQLQHPVKATNGMATAAMVVGIVGAVLGVIPLLALFAIACGITALVLGVISRRRAREIGAGKGQATAGVLLGIVALGLGIVGFAIVDDVLTDLKTDLDSITVPD